MNNKVDKRHVDRLIANECVFTIPITRADGSESEKNLAVSSLPPAIPFPSNVRRLPPNLSQQMRDHLVKYASKLQFPRQFELMSPGERKRCTIQYLNNKKNVLLREGYCLFENVLSVPSLVNQNHVDDLFQYMNRNFDLHPCTDPAQIISNGDPSRLWMPILYRKLKRQPTKDTRRYQTWSWKVKNYLPESIDKIKSHIELLLGIILQEMFRNDDQETQLPPFSFPNYGSSFLRSSENTEPQVLHCDFPPFENTGSVPYHTDPPLFNLFLMYSSRQSFVIRVAPYSPGLMNVKKCKLKQAARNINSKLVIIPPYSVLVARGDLIHAGVSGNECKQASNKYLGASDVEKTKASEVLEGEGCVRYNTRGHLYATREARTFDAIFRTPP